MGITLDGDVTPGGQVVESNTFGGQERQTMSIGGWGAQAEQAAVKNVDPGYTAYGLASRVIKRTTTTTPTVNRVSATGDTATLAANPTRWRYKVESDPTSGTGLVYVMEGTAASATNWITCLAAGEAWDSEESDDLFLGAIHVFLTTGAIANVTEWNP